MWNYRGVGQCCQIQLSGILALFPRTIVVCILLIYNRLSGYVCCLDFNCPGAFTSPRKLSDAYPGSVIIVSADLPGPGAPLRGGVFFPFSQAEAREGRTAEPIA
jgi:hypothetical protein